MPEDTVEEATGPVDVETLERIARRLDGSARFATVVSQLAYAPNSIVAEYDLGYFPASVTRASLQIRWFETNDFSVHYSEQYRDERLWECRWDRHPNDHNTQAHFHPPPDAQTPGVDATCAADWRDLLTQMVTELDDRIEAFWK